MDTQRIFILRLKGREKASFDENVVGIGWSKAKEINKCRDREALKAELDRVFPGYSPRGLGNIGGSIWNFLHEMPEGSLVVVPLSGSFKVAEVLGDSPYYDESCLDDDYAWRRKVNWLTPNEVPRSYASNTLQRRMKCQQTCIEITLLRDDLHAALDRKNPISFKEELYSDSRPVVVKHLLDSVTPTQLEELIASIYEAQGHQAMRLPTFQEKAGDIDVRVEIDTGLGEDAKPLAIGIQVKQHEGVTDVHAVQQIADRLGESGSIDRGIVVTTANDFAEDARKMAEEHDIALVSRDELASWILDNLGKLEY